MKIKLESTPAKIGRRIKKCEKFINKWTCGRLLESPLWWITRNLPTDGLQILTALHRGDIRFGRDRHSRPDPLQAVNNDLVPGIESSSNNPFAVDGRAKLHRTAFGCIGGRQCHHELLSL